MPFSIASQFTRVQALKETIDPVEFFSNSHKRDREWDVLGATHRILSASPYGFPDFAEERLRPDFMTFLSDGSRSMPVEITEALRPNERRHQKYMQGAASGSRFRALPPPLEDPWAALQNAIMKKASAGYSSDTALIVYFGLWLFDLKEWSIPMAAQVARRHQEQPFQGVDVFSHVFVLTSGMDSAVTLNKKC